MPSQVSTRRTFIPLLLGLLLLPTALFSQRVFWEPAGGTLGVGKSNQLSLVFENCAPEGNIALPAIPGLNFSRPSISQQTSIVNFRSSRRVTYAYAVQPTQRGTIEIPTFEVRTDEGRLPVEVARFEVGDAAVGQSGRPISELIESQLTPLRSTLWVGEVVEIEYLLVATNRFNTSLASDPIWNPPGIIAEAFGKAERAEVTQGGERRPAVRYRARFIASEPGRFVLPAVQQRVNVQTGERGGFFFSQPRIEEFAITSNQPEIEVRALPQPAPDDFFGAVGDFSIESKIVPENARVGEPITWTLTLSGTGNWPSGLRLPERAASADFEVVQPDAREEIDEGKMFSGSLVEDAVLVPTKAGRYELGPISFSFFDPASGAYRTEFIAGKTVTIQPLPTARSPLLPPPPSVPGFDPSAAPGPGETGTRPAPALPGDLANPSQLPRDPLPDGSSGLAPLDFDPAWWFFVAFIPPSLAWLAFAWRIVRLEDDTRRRRAAKQEMLSLLARMHGGGQMPARGDLARWRRLTTDMWDIRRAEPTRDDLGRAISGAHGKHAVAWIELWREAESALFGSEPGLPEDWTLRALRAVRETKIVRDQPGYPHRIRHWAPRLSLFALGLLALATTRTDAADIDARRLYQEGKFAQARAVWLDRLAAKPLDWSAHNNTALAYAQEERWADAAAHWTAALLLHPDEPSVRANLRLALAHLDGVDPAIRRVFSDTLRNRAMQVFSPGGWQIVFLFGAVVVAAGLAMIVGGLYWPGSRRWRRIGVSCAAAGVISSAVAKYCESLYGPLAEPSAGMVVQPTELYSIPSDLAENQQKTLLAPGAIVVVDVDRSFLGWERVWAGGGVTGWLRREVITPFFDTPHVIPGAAARENISPEKLLRIDEEV